MARSSTGSVWGRTGACSAMASGATHSVATSNLQPVDIRRRYYASRHWGEDQQVLPRQKFIALRQPKPAECQLGDGLVGRHLVLGLDGHRWVLGTKFDQHQSACGLQRPTQLAQEGLRVHRLVVDVD